MSEVVIPATRLRDALTGALPFAAKGDMVRTLESVKLTWTTDGGVTVHATNRRTLVEARFAETKAADSGSVLLPIDLAKDAVKMVRRPRTAAETVTLKVDGGLVTVVAETGQAVAGLCPEGEFPKVDRLWPDGEPMPRTEIGISPELVAQLAKIPGPTQWRLEFRGDKPMTAEPCSQPADITWRALIMPVRIEAGR